MKGDPMTLQRLIARTICITGLICLLPGVLAPVYAAMTPVQYWMAGTRYAENKLYIDAVANFTEAIRKNKGEISIEDAAKIFSSRGLAYMGLDRPDDALSDFSNAIDLDEKNPEYYLHRARLYADLKQYRKARTDFDEAIKLAPRNTAGYEGRGLVALASGDRTQAIEDYETVLSLEPRNWDALYRLGLAYKGAKKDDAALDAFDRLIKAVNTHPDAAYQKAGIFARQKKIDSACVWLEIAVQDGYKDWSALRNDGDFDTIRKNPCYLKVLAGK